MTLGLDARLGDVRRFLEKVWWHVLPEVPGGKLAKLRYAKSDVFYRVDNRAEGLRQAEAGLREPSAVRWLEDHVGHDEVLYHIGAGVGTFALLAAKLRNGSGQGRVLAFESDPVLERSFPSRCICPPAAAPCARAWHSVWMTSLRRSISRAPSMSFWRRGGNWRS
jgi:hypothetical protein